MLEQSTTSLRQGGSSPDLTDMPIEAHGHAVHGESPHAPPSSSAPGHEVSGRSFSGEVVVFTGRLKSLRRREARELVERLGGLAAAELSARTTMLVVGSDRSLDRSREARMDATAQPVSPRRLHRAERLNARVPGRIRIVTEDEFCRRAGLIPPEVLQEQFHALRDLLARYPAVREDHLRYMEKWGLIRSVARTNTQSFYRFEDLRLIRQAAVQLESGMPFRSVLRTLLAAREGQLAFDFRPSRSDAQPARVVSLPPRPTLLPTGNAKPARPSSVPSRVHESAAVDEFLLGSALDGDSGSREAAAAAYRRALVSDPTLVPALINLANLHYASDRLVEAQALYERALTLEPGCFEAHFNLGNVLHDIGCHEAAVERYRAALRLNPTYAEAHFYLAVTLEKLGRSPEAKPHWRMYQALAPDGQWVELAKEFSD